MLWETNEHVGSTCEDVQTNFYHYYNQKWVCVYIFDCKLFREQCRLGICYNFLIYLKNICKIVTCKYPNYIVVVLDLVWKRKMGNWNCYEKWQSFPIRQTIIFKLSVCAIKPLSFNMQFWNRIHVMISDSCGMKEKVIKTKCMTHNEREEENKKTKLLWHAKRAEHSRMNSLSELYV